MTYILEEGTTNKMMTEASELLLTEQNFFDQALSDSATTTDLSMPRTPGKKIVNTATLSEARQMSIGHKIVNSVTLAEIFRRAIGRGIQSSVSLSETIRFGRLKTLVETITATEAMTRAIGAVMADSVTIHEVLNRYAGKILNDNPVLLDSIRRDIGALIIDEASLSDVRQVSVMIAFLEAFTVDDLDLSYQKHVGAPVEVAARFISEIFGVPDMVAEVFLRMQTVRQSSQQCGFSDEAFEYPKFKNERVAA